MENLCKRAHCRGPPCLEQIRLIGVGRASNCVVVLSFFFVEKRLRCAEKGGGNVRPVLGRLACTLLGAVLEAN